MSFRKSLIISAVIHILAVFFLPGFRFAQIQTDWIEVSMVTFPDFKDRLPDWRPGRRIIPKPAKKNLEIDKSLLPIPSEDSDIGIPIQTKNPSMPDITEDREIKKLEEEFEKIVPGRREKKGVSEETGEESNMVISGPVTKRKLIRKIYPKYPVWAEEKGVEGEVELKFWVSPEGMVSSVALAKTSGYPDLDSRAMEALKKYLFSPLGKNEEQKSQWGTITIKYTLR